MFVRDLHIDTLKVKGRNIRQELTFSSGSEVLVPSRPYL